MKKKWKILIVGIFCVMTLILWYDFMPWIQETTDRVVQEFHKETKREIDFVKLQEKNPDIYAWIEVSGTKIDYPIVQSDSKEDTFYLTHDIEQEPNTYGAIYTEAINSKEFTDLNTVIYGHNMQDGSMFGSLDSFADEMALEKNQEFKVYTPKVTNTYRIFAAYPFTNDHLLQQVKERQELNKEEQEKAGVVSTDKIVTLSTCTDTDNQKRFLVQGVLVKSVQVQ